MQPAPGAETAGPPAIAQARITTRRRTPRAARVKEIVQNLGGGEVVIHDRQGLIRDNDTLRPAKDPFPPRDKLH